MEWLDFYALWFARSIALAWMVWGGLHLIDQPVTFILKWTLSYGKLCEFCFYRKRFLKWVEAQKLPRIGDDGNWIGEKGSREDD